MQQLAISTKGSKKNRHPNVHLRQLAKKSTYVLKSFQVFS
jgi:hypothetical protein